MRSCPPNDWWVKIADFGISKRIEDSLGKPTTLRGTEGYIAPELYELSQRGTPYAVDIWAAGEIMFQLLTKQPTFQHVGLLFKYVQMPDIFPCNQLLANEVSQLGVEFVLCLMHPTPAGRMSAKDALQHRWIDHALPYNRKSAPLAYKEACNTSAPESMTEKFASWSTTKPPDSLETFISRRKEELETSSLQTSSNENLMSEPVQQKTATAARMMLPGTLKGHSSRVTCVAFSSDGKLVASGSDDLKVKLWNTTTGAIYRAFESHSQSVTCVAFSVDGKFVVAGSDDQTIIFWNIITGATHRTLKGSSYVRSVAFSPDGQLGASGYDGGTVELWNNITGTIYKTLKDPFSVPFLAFSPDSKLLASGSIPSQIKLWDTTMGDLHTTLDAHERVLWHSRQMED